MFWKRLYNILCKMENLNISNEMIFQMNNILNSLDISYMKMNNMYSGNYVYTLNRFKEMFRKSANSFGISGEIADIYLLNIINEKYIPEVQKQCAEIAKIPIIEQKSPEWFRQRETMISASDAGYFLKKCGASRAVDSLKIKLGCKSYASSMAKPLLHGNTYEDVSRAIYETRNAVSVTEYGIINSPTPFIGASPDGIVTMCHKNTFDCKAKYGRLLEIKNPYSREIDETIKPEYMVQILQQQYTTQLPVCDFVETTIVDINCNLERTNYKPYTTLEEMLSDVLNTSNPNWEKRIKNHNIPYQNLNKFGNEKGLIVWYSKKIKEDDIRNRYIMYPLTSLYEYNTIKKWIIEENGKQFSEGFGYITTKYWRLDVYSEKTVIYDMEIFENNYVPELTKIWDVICKCKELKENGKNVLEYIETLEKDKTNPFYNGNKRKKKQVETEPDIEGDTNNNYKDIDIDF